VSGFELILDVGLQSGEVITAIGLGDERPDLERLGVFQLNDRARDRLTRRVGHHAFHSACGGVFAFLLGEKAGTNQNEREASGTDQHSFPRLFRLALQQEGYFHALLIGDVYGLLLALVAFGVHCNDVLQGSWRDAKNELAPGIGDGLERLALAGFALAGLRLWSYGDIRAGECVSALLEHATAYDGVSIEGGLFLGSSRERKEGGQS